MNKRSEQQEADGIVVRRLTKRFGGAVAVDGVSFRAARGEVTAFLGPNGAGKTTTLRMLLGLARPDAGDAVIDGRPYRSHPSPRRHVGAVLDSVGFHPGRTARNHLRIQATAIGLPHGRVDEVLEIVDLAAVADRRVGGYSLGMGRRLALASALLGDPQVLVLDEPSNGLDPAGVAWLRALIRSWADQGRTALVSTHLLAEVGMLADHVVIIDRGTVVHEGAMGDVGDDLEAVFLDLTATRPGAVR